VKFCDASTGIKLSFWADGRGGRKNGQMEENGRTDRRGRWNSYLDNLPLSNLNEIWNPSIPNLCGIPTFYRKLKEAAVWTISKFEYKNLSSIKKCLSYLGNRTSFVLFWWFHLFWLLFSPFGRGLLSSLYLFSASMSYNEKKSKFSLIHKLANRWCTSLFCVYF